MRRQVRQKWARQEILPAFYFFQKTLALMTNHRDRAQNSDLTPNRADTITSLLMFFRDFESGLLVKGGVGSAALTTRRNLTESSLHTLNDGLILTKIGSYRGVQGSSSSHLGFPDHHCRPRTLVRKE